MSMIDTLSALELATKRVFPSRYSAVGCRPTRMVATTFPVARSTALTVPLVTAPVTRLETTAVVRLSVRLVGSPLRGWRPPSLETNAVPPAITTCRGETPMGVWWRTALVAVSIVARVLLPLKAT